MDILHVALSVAAALALAVLLGTLASIYNSIVRLRHSIDRAWSNVDVLLKQRHDELSKLVEVVKGSMRHEREVLTRLTDARAAMRAARSVTDKAAAHDRASGALASLYAVAEAHPDLKVSDNFLELQRRISALEDHIADRREFYNDAVNNYNIRIEQVPDVLLARLLGCRRRDLFEIGESEAEGVRLEP